MRSRLIAVCCALFPAAALATSWQFEAPVAITTVSGPKLFHHLESAGRRNIAVSGERVAVAWEDDRDGTPRIYLASKLLTGESFAQEMRLSGPGEAYEPTLAALGGGRFVVAWEEEQQLHLRMVEDGVAGAVLTMPAVEAAQASLAVSGSEVLMVSAERSGRYPRIMLHRLQPAGGTRLELRTSCAVDADPPGDEQLYPTVVAQGQQVIVSWEDRRPGHTVIMASRSPAAEPCNFTQPQRISLRPEREQKMPYGKGHGVARVAMAGYGQSGVLAAWADKRDFREGYDIYAATLQPGGGFGANERVQDEFGGVARQWHASVAGHPDGTVVVAWDDDRDGDENVMLSWRENGEWSDDVVLPGAGGAGVQAHPSITLDGQGNLHAAWVARETVDGPTRLYYVFGRAGEE